MFLANIIVVLLTAYQLGFAISHIDNTDEQDGLWMTEVQVHVEALRKNLGQLEEDFKYMGLTSEELEEIDGNIFSFSRRLETVKPRDKFEWARMRADLEEGYRDLIRDLHAYRTTNHRQR
jgi:hypothetical protein